MVSNKLNFSFKHNILIYCHASHTIFLSLFTITERGAALVPALILVWFQHFSLNSSSNRHFIAQLKHI